MGFDVEICINNSNYKNSNTQTVIVVCFDGETITEWLIPQFSNHTEILIEKVGKKGINTLRI